MKFPGVNLSQIRVIDCGPRVRVGRERDGGYVLPQKVVERCTTLLSFGISSDWSFEADFLSRNPRTKVLGFDHSIGAPMFIKRAARSFPAALLHRLTGNAKRAARSLERGKAAVDYFHFFKDRATHYPFRIWNVGDRKTKTIADVMALVPEADRGAILVKMDIEGAEYRVLADVMPYAAQIDCLAVEFHDTDICASAFDALIALLSANFCIVHVHGNNVDPIAANGFPQTAEITFLNRRLLPEALQPLREALPSPGLDFPNDLSKPDVDLSFLKP